jgi:hypothetical protein
VRQVFLDWANERPANLVIERVDAPYPPPAPLGEAAVRARGERLVRRPAKAGTYRDHMCIRSGGAQTARSGATRQPASKPTTAASPTWTGSVCAAGNSRALLVDSARPITRIGRAPEWESGARPTMWHCSRATVA